MHLAACQGDDDSGRACTEKGEDDAPAQREEQDQRGGQDGVLPVMGQRPGQWDGRAEDGADGGGPGAVEEGPRVGVAADLVEPGRAERKLPPGLNSGATVAGPLIEKSCAENPFSYFGDDGPSVPRADRPDF